MNSITILFTILAMALGLAGCGPARVKAPADASHLEGDAWFAWRAQQLGVTPDAARARDAALPEDAPPEQLSPAVRAQAAATWDAVCSTCHGADGTPPDRPDQPRPKRWGTMGTAMGFTFGGDGMRAGVYRSIRDGKGTVMIPWGDRLAREHIWALVAHLESL